MPSDEALKGVRAHDDRDSQILPDLQDTNSSSNIDPNLDVNPLHNHLPTSSHSNRQTSDGTIQTTSANLPGTSAVKTSPASLTQRRPQLFHQPDNLTTPIRNAMASPTYGSNPAGEALSEYNRSPAGKRRKMKPRSQARTANSRDNAQQGGKIQDPASGLLQSPRIVSSQDTHIRPVAAAYPHPSSSSPEECLMHDQGLADDLILRIDTLLKATKDILEASRRYRLLRLVIRPFYKAHASGSDENPTDEELLRKINSPLDPAIIAIAMDKAFYKAGWRQNPKSPVAPRMERAFSAPSASTSKRTTNSHIGTSVSRKRSKPAASTRESVTSADTRTTVSQPTEFPCHTCSTESPRIFHTSKQWKNHYDKHFPECYWACGECGKPFNRSDSMIPHWKGVHATAGELRKTRKNLPPWGHQYCIYCDQNFSGWHTNMRKKHMLDHIINGTITQVQHRCSTDPEPCGKPNESWRGSVSGQEQPSEDGETRSQGLEEDHPHGTLSGDHRNNVPRPKITLNLPTFGRVVSSPSPNNRQYQPHAEQSNHPSQDEHLLFAETSVDSFIDDPFTYVAYGAPKPRSPLQSSSEVQKMKGGNVVGGNDGRDGPPYKTPYPTFLDETGLRS